MSFEVGQKVLIVFSDNRRTEREAEIARVGRKYAFVQCYGSEIAYHLDTGREKSDYGSPSTLYTPEDWADEQKRQNLIKELMEAGLFFRSVHNVEFSTGTLERLLEVMFSQDES